MSAALHRYPLLSHLTGWALAFAYLAHSTVTIRVARSPKLSDLRWELRDWHYLIGSILFALAIARLVAWRRERGVAPPPGLSPAAHHWGRTLMLATLLLVLISPVLGMLYGWSDGFPLKLFGLPVPALMGEDRATWMFTGYFHSGAGFMLLLLNLVAVLTAAYTTLRYGRGLLSAFPPGYGAQAFFGVSSTVYSFATFRSPEPGPRAVAIFWALCAAVAVVGWLIHRRRERAVRMGIPGWVRVAAPLGAAGVVAAGAYGPHALFRVTPWPTTKVVEGGPRTMVMRVALTPETDFERTTAQETYKWCRFCHTVDKGEKHLVGPNLYAIWGQRAGTAPGFAYSEAMLRARDRGLVWNDRTIADYIHNPDGYIPGTTMIISSGPVTDPAVRQAVVNILKRETMGQATPPLPVSSPRP